MSNPLDDRAIYGPCYHWTEHAWTNREMADFSAEMRRLDTIEAAFANFNLDAFVEGIHSGSRN